MKKILYLSSSTLPSIYANSVHTIKMCEYLSKNDNCVTLISRYNKKTTNDIFQIYNVKYPFKIIQLRNYYLGKVGFFLNFIFLIYKLLKNKYDIVCGRNIYFIFLFILFKNKIILELHLPFHKQNFFEKKIINLIIKNSQFSKLVVISEYIKETYINKTNKTISVIQDGAEILNFDNLKEKIIKDKFNIGYCGSIYKGRGLELIIDLAKANQDILFHIIGGSKEQVKKIKETNKNLKNLILYGHQTYYKSQIMIQKFDLLIAPYQKKVQIKNGTDTSKWMSPLKIFEYMASGIPFICSDLEVFNSYLKNKVNCLLVKPNSVDDWSNSIKILKNDSVMRKMLSKNSQELIKNKYSWDMRVKNILTNID